MPLRPRWLSLLAAAAAALPLVGCGRPAIPLPPPPATVTLTASEYRITRQPAQLRQGRVVLDVTNAGRLAHQITVFPIPVGLSGTLDQQLRSARRIPASPLVVLPTLATTEHNKIALDLPPGRYGLVCFLKDDDGTSHAVKGVNAELHVR